MQGEFRFASFFQGGFESSTARWHDGRRLDLIATTRHDVRAGEDYTLLRGLGVATVRDALRWHLIEAAPGRYDWASVRPMLRAARDSGTQVIWDLCHYGVPDDIDIASPAFVDRFAEYAAAAARVIAEESGAAPILCPVNEMSFWAWAGPRRIMAPHLEGAALKRQLAAATIAAVDAVRDVAPDARFIQAEPLIDVIPRPAPEGGLRRGDRARAQAEREAQYEATDMVTGRMAPELGGTPGHLDVVGLNFYSYNEWLVGGETLYLGHREYRPLAALLGEVYARYRKPLLIAETGAEGASAPGWLRYVAGEVRTALRAGVPILGICLYPVLDYPGWDNNRHCRCGLLATDKWFGPRRVDTALASQIKEEWRLIGPVLADAGAEMATV